MELSRDLFWAIRACFVVHQSAIVVLTYVQTNRGKRERPSCFRTTYQAWKLSWGVFQRKLWRWKVWMTASYLVSGFLLCGKYVFLKKCFTKNWLVTVTGYWFSLRCFCVGDAHHAVQDDRQHNITKLACFPAGHSFVFIRQGATSRFNCSIKSYVYEVSLQQRTA